VTPFSGDNFSGFIEALIVTLFSPSSLSWFDAVFTLIKETKGFAMISGLFKEE